MKNYLIATSFLFLTFDLLGQRYVDIAKIYYSNSAVNNFVDSDSTTRVKEFGADFSVPVVINSTDAIVTGLIYEWNQTKLFESEPEETFSVIGIRVGLSKKHSDRWSGTYVLIPKFASDFKNLSKEDFQIGAIVLMKYTKHENFNYKLGVYYNKELFGPLVVPLFGLYYLNKSEKFEANLTLPFQADANYRLHHRLNIGINFNAQVRSYHLNNLPENNSGGYVVKSSNDLFAYLKLNLSKGLSVQTKAGYALGRSYRVFADGDKVDFASILLRVGDDRQQLNTDFSNGFVYQVTTMYRFHL